MTRTNEIKEWTTHSEQETVEWANSFAQRLKRGDVVSLKGNLGAGKTVLSRGIARGLGFQGGVHSPSYSLVHEYPNDPPIFHMDLYRLGPHADLHEIGIEHYSFGEGITLIEWPERLAGLQLGIHFQIEITRMGDEDRKITLVTL